MAPLTVIQPAGGWGLGRLRELWASRELLVFLAWRDVSVRYKQTLLGATWALVQPVATTIAFSVVFGRLARMPSDGVPYPLFALCGLLPWMAFAAALNLSTNSVISNAALMTKVYFPRVLAPLASMAPAVVDLLVSLAALGALLAYYGVFPGARLLWLPLVLPLPIVCAAGLGVWFAGLSARYRDIRHVLPFLTQFWMFVSPVIYPSSAVPETYRAFYALNPVVGAIEALRWVFLGQGQLNLLPVSSVVAVALLLSGIFWFLRVDRSFADVV